MRSLGVPALIKWPNDMVAAGAKIGGILIEEKAGRIMAGFGMNICTAPEPAPGQTFFKLEAGCLKRFGVTLNSSDVWRLILETVLIRIPAMMSNPSSVVENAGSLLAWHGETVILQGTACHDGPARILGLDSGGRLMIQTNKGLSFIHSGSLYPRVA